MAEGPGPSDATQPKNFRVRRKFGPGGGENLQAGGAGCGPWRQPGARMAAERPAHDERNVRGRMRIGERDAREGEREREGPHKS